MWRTQPSRPSLATHPGTKHVLARSQQPMNSLASFSIAVLLGNTALTPPSRVLTKEAHPQEQRVSVIIGSVLVPAGSVSYRTGGSVDAFVGHIQVSRPAVRVLYA